MNELDIKKLADEASVDIRGHILSLPVERQKEIAKTLGYGNDFERYVTEKINELIEKKNNPDEPVFFATKEEAERAGYTIPRWYDEPIIARLVK